MKTYRGMVIFFSDLKGFGFVRPEPSYLDSTGHIGDVFVHHSGIAAGGYRTLKKAQIVEFETAERNGKTIAVNVRPVQESK
jgi:cold shock CspA family protein